MRYWLTQIEVYSWVPYWRRASGRRSGGLRGSASRLGSSLVLSLGSRTLSRSHCWSSPALPLLSAIKQQVIILSNNSSINIRIISYYKNKILRFLLIIRNSTVLSSVNWKFVLIVTFLHMLCIIMLYNGIHNYNTCCCVMNEVNWTVFQYLNRL